MITTAQYSVCFLFPHRDGTQKLWVHLWSESDLAAYAAARACLANCGLDIDPDRDRVRAEVYTEETTSTHSCPLLVVGSLEPPLGARAPEVPVSYYETLTVGGAS